MSIQNKGWRSHVYHVGAGAAYAVVWSVLSAGGVALVYHFPIPFGSPVSGIGGVFPSMGSMIFIVALGSLFVPIGFIGALVGLAVTKLTSHSSQQTTERMILAATFPVGLCARCVSRFSNEQRR